uniref:Putative secreted peptide n=1 Tax=Anopheles braziliensis TaxID=58242 RepID=A0A2M3ZQY2_9DIPT
MRSVCLLLLLLLLLQMMLMIDKILAKRFLCRCTHRGGQGVRLREPLARWLTTTGTTVQCQWLVPSCCKRSSVRRYR